MGLQDAEKALAANEEELRNVHDAACNNSYVDGYYGLRDLLQRIDPTITDTYYHIATGNLGIFNEDYSVHRQEVLHLLIRNF